MKFRLGRGTRAGGDGKTEDPIETSCKPIPIASAEERGALPLNRRYEHTKSLSSRAVIRKPVAGSQFLGGGGTTERM